MIIVTFAMAEESKEFLPLLENRRDRTVDGRTDLPIVEGTYGGVAVTVVHLGVGEASAEKRLRESGALGGPYKPTLLICPGYGGGLSPQLAHGDVLLVENYSDPRVLERAQMHTGRTGVHRGNLTSQMVVIESAADKAALCASTGAVAVDMETAAVAKLCTEAGVPMLAFRVISDDANTTLPVPGYLLWDLETQRPPMAKLLWYLVTHPGRIGALRSMLTSLAPVRARLTDVLRRTIPPLAEITGS